MDIPVTPKFFKKLELYQELKRLDKRNKKHEEWEIEKAFLEWAQANHFHLGTFLDTVDIIKILESTRKFDEKQLNDHVFKMMQNLEEHGWADWFSPREYKNAIKINREGLFLAEVITEVKTKWRNFLYVLFIILAWAVMIAGIIIIISSAFKIIRSLFIN